MKQPAKCIISVSKSLLDLVALKMVSGREVDVEYSTIHPLLKERILKASRRFIKIIAYVKSSISSVR